MRVRVRVLFVLFSVLFTVSLHAETVNEQFNKASKALENPEVIKVLKDPMVQKLLRNDKVFEAIKNPKTLKQVLDAVKDPKKTAQIKDPEVRKALSDPDVKKALGKKEVVAFLGRSDVKSTLDMVMGNPFLRSLAFKYVSALRSKALANSQPGKKPSETKKPSNTTPVIQSETASADTKLFLQTSKGKVRIGGGLELKLDELDFGNFILSANGSIGGTGDRVIGNLEGDVTLYKYLLLSLKAAEASYEKRLYGALGIGTRLKILDESGTLKLVAYPGFVYQDPNGQAGTVCGASGLEASLKQMLPSNFSTALKINNYLIYGNNVVGVGNHFEIGGEVMKKFQIYGPVHGSFGGFLSFVHQYYKYNLKDARGNDNGIGTVSRPGFVFGVKGGIAF